MKPNRIAFPVAFSIMAMIHQAPLRAEVLLIETFNYGLANNATMNGVAATGTGLTGSWTVANSGTASSVYQQTGLSFGPNYSTSNGALLTTSTYSGSNSFTTATVQLNVSTAGTLWGSYLINWSAISLSGGGSTIAGIGGFSAPADNTDIMLRSQMVSNTVASDRKIGSGYDAAATLSGNTSIVTGTTYMYVSKYTNVGTPLSDGTTGVATTWMLTLDQYNALHTAGNLTEAGLNASGAVMQKVSDPAVVGGTYNFNGTRYLTLKADAPDSNGHQTNAIWDEIKFGTEIGDVIGVVPEPSLACLSGIAAGLLGFRRYRKQA